MHRKPLTDIEMEGLKAHGLAIGKPSQLSDCFRLGMQWANANPINKDQAIKDSLEQRNDKLRSEDAITTRT